MPRYTYRCEACAATYNLIHSMSDRAVVCKECGESSLIRMPSSFVSKTVASATDETFSDGHLVNEFIENTKKEIKSEKKNMTKDLEL